MTAFSTEHNNLLCLSPVYEDNVQRLLYLEVTCFKYHIHCSTGWVESTLCFLVHIAKHGHYQSIPEL